MHISTICVLKGCRAIQSALIEELKHRCLEKEVKAVETGLGISGKGPVMLVYPEGVREAEIDVGGLKVKAVDSLTLPATTSARRVSRRSTPRTKACR